MGRKVLMLASVASMIDQFNMPNIRLLQTMGYEVHVACNFAKGNTCDEMRIRSLQKMLQELSVCQHAWDCPRAAFSVLECLRAYRQLLELMKQHHFAWIHCHSPVGGVLARLAARRQGIRVIYTAHGFHFYSGAALQNWLLYYPLEKLLSHWTDVLVTVNQEDTYLAKRRLYAGKVRRIPGVGIDTEAYQKSCRYTKEQFHRKYKIPENAIVLLSVGELSRRKNHRLVLAALSMLRRQDVYYLICGQGKERRRLKQAAGRLGVGHYLRLPGYEEDLRWIYQNADIFVFPSLQEGMPVALMEAMAAGLPCVVSDIRGSRELIDSLAGGMRFTPGSVQELSHALEWLLSSKEARKLCGQYNQEKIKGFRIEAVQRRMKRIYEAMDTDTDLRSERRQHTKGRPGDKQGADKEGHRHQ